VRGFRRSAIQVKGAEKFFQKENRQLEKARRKAARRATGRSRRFIVLVAVLLIVVALGAFMLSQQTQITRLRALRDVEIEVLRSRVAALSAEMKESDRQVQTLKENVSGLEKQVETEQSQRIRAEAALRNRSVAKKRLPDQNGG
jgi:hypothetical protein